MRYIKYDNVLRNYITTLGRWALKAICIQFVERLPLGFGAKTRAFRC